MKQNPIYYLALTGLAAFYSASSLRAATVDATPVPSTLDPDSVVLRVENLRRKDTHGRP